MSKVIKIYLQCDGRGKKAIHGRVKDRKKTRDRRGRKPEVNPETTQRLRWAGIVERWEMAHKLEGESTYEIKVKMRKKEMSAEMKEQREER